MAKTGGSKKGKDMDVKKVSGSLDENIKYKRRLDLQKDVLSRMMDSVLTDETLTEVHKELNRTENK